MVGYLGGKLLAVATERGWTSEVSEQIAILALALLAYEGSVAIGGNGFIAAFAGGILFGAATRRRLAEPVQFTETLGLSASFLVWSIFGALFVGELLNEDLSARPIVYALLSLTVIRMVPVAIALIGTHLRPATVAFMGWFGPRGLASVVFTLLALEEIERGGDGDDAPADRHLDHPALGGAARHLGVPARRPVRGVDRDGGRHPGEGNRRRAPDPAPRPRRTAPPGTHRPTWPPDHAPEPTDDDVTSPARSERCPGRSAGGASRSHCCGPRPSRRSSSPRTTSARSTA